MLFTGCKTAAELNGWFSDNIKVQYLQFMGHMKTPQYRSNLQQLLEEEKVRANIAFVTLLTVLMHCVILITFCHCGSHLLICIFCSHSSSFIHFIHVFPFLNPAKAQGPVRAGGAAPLCLSGSQGQDQRSLSGQAG